MLFFRKLFKLPSPVDLGWSEYNALASRDFTPDCQGPTWEDWHVEVKKRHPVKYFLAETLADFIKYKIWFKFSVPFERLRYFLVSHLFFNRRYHMLDLRQPCKKGDIKNYDCYRYGWADVPQKMLYAMFNLLGEYLNGEDPTDLTKWHTLEEINADAGMKSQQDALNEARALYHWWSVERQQELNNHNQLLSDWHEARQNKSPETERLWELLKQDDINFENKTDEMIGRLMKIRRSLWT